MKVKVCQNCQKRGILRKIYIELDDKYEIWCTNCRINYKEDSKILSKRIK